MRQADVLRGGLASLAILTTMTTYAGLAGAHGAAPSDRARPQPNILHQEPLPQGAELTAIRLHVPPAGASPAHHHAGTLFVYLLSGSVRSGLNDGTPVTYQPGDSWMEPEGTQHTYFENASETESAELLAIFVAPQGADLTVLND